MTAKFALLERDKRRLVRLRKLLAETTEPTTGTEVVQLARTIRSLEAGMDPPVCALEFRTLIRHD